MVPTVTPVSYTHLEKSAQARAFAKEHFNLDVKPHTALKDFAPGSFDVITLWHVMEHLEPVSYTHLFQCPLSRTDIRTAGKHLNRNPYRKAHGELLLCQHTALVMTERLCQQQRKA